ncbi:hypothetical protein N0V93_001480 [Gnomoniopsis smithogilvyi]|uniref:NmrA-like domain-containing protein n=1 Tax=Gnomoniopsis smithogilvyi TaxID=1191159 RepID=A0A9W8Z1P9_9PEZI|nr:hypothetical protein N0V93_001480 [Gnomoniopsis smithogilvyi]
MRSLAILRNSTEKLHLTPTFDMSVAPIRVVVIGATGKTGNSVVKGLVASSTSFEITALTRASSLHNESNNALRDLGAKVVAFDIQGPKEDLIPIFAGQDVVISCVHASQIDAQLNLIEPLKEAKVKRFIPCNFATAAPAGVMAMHDRKLRVVDAVQRAYIPYTVIDDSWWYQGVCPSVPSGKTDHGVFADMNDRIYGDGDVPQGLMDMNDVGLYVAEIIADPRTINKKVYIYSEVLTQNQIWATVADITGEEPLRHTVSKDEILRTIADSAKILEKNPNDIMGFLGLTVNQYRHSYAIRGDNTPERAVYLGYLDGHELYPEVKTTTFREYFQKLVDNKPPGAGKLSVAEFLKSVGFEITK